MKICFVVLEKLDEKRINQYLQKCDLKKTTKKIDSIKNSKSQIVSENIINCNGYVKTEKNSKESNKDKRDNSKDSVSERKLLSKKRKLKISGHTTNVSSKNAFEKNEVVVTEDDKTIKLRDSSNPADNRDRLKRTYESDKNVMIKYKESTTSEVEEKRHNMTLKTLLEDLSSCKSAPLCTEVTEIEIVEEYLNHRNNFQNKNCDKTEASLNREWLFVNRDSLQAKLFEEDEYDLREDNEDDKKTVIFEEGIYKDEDSDVFDIDEKEIELGSSELKKREKINQKSQKLMEFTKNFEVRNLEMVRRPGGKITKPSVGQKVTEVSPSPEGISEDCLRAVCCLIQRLYELYKIIVHLQMELQNNNGLPVHFSKIINSQQEQFQREIRKSQETIIKCYEKMLLFYKSADEVALIISKRTSLSPDEVIEVISHCLFVEGASELEKSEPEAREEKVFEPLKVLCKSDNLVEIINRNSERLQEKKMVQKTNCHVPSSHSYFLSGRNSDLCQTMTDKSILIQGIPAKENSKISSQNPSDPVIGISPLQCQMQEIQHENLKPYRIQKKLHSQSLLKNPRINQSQQTQCQPFIILPPRPPHHLINSLACPNQNIILSYPKFNYPVNASQLEHSSLLTVPTSVSNTELLVNCNSKNSSVMSDISKPGSRVLIPVAAGNTVQCNTLPHQSDLLNGAFLSPARMVNSQKQVLIPSNEIRCPLNLFRFPNQKFVSFLPNGLLLHSGEMAENHSGVEGNISTELRNDSSRVPEESQVLDPTVPQKLTMKNWRLQAGPVLDLETEKETESRNKQNLYQSLKKKKLGCQELGNSDQEDSKTRQYVCAQTDCKKPGIRICEGCQSIIYCSKSCQLKNWAQKHKLECYQLKKLCG